MTHAIKQTIQTSAKPAAAFAAVSTQAGVRSWWTKDCDVAEREGGEATLRFRDGAVSMTFRIDERKPESRVKWTCITHPDPRWVGTTLTWSLQANKGGVELTFAHEGWPEVPPQDVQQGWQHFIQESLKSLLDTGTGKPW